jgi:hypothetical protein
MLFRSYRASSGRTVEAINIWLLRSPSLLLFIALSAQLTLRIEWPHRRASLIVAH